MPSLICITQLAFPRLLQRCASCCGLLDQPLSSGQECFFPARCLCSNVPSAYGSRTVRPCLSGQPGAKSFLGKV